MDKFVDEYCGWCEFLGDTHRQWAVVLQRDLTADNLAAYPIVVLPSVLTLTDTQLGALRQYVERGGRLVATGLTGTRYGPERHLAPRAEVLALPARVLSATSRVWRIGGRHAIRLQRRRLAELLDWPGLPPRLETDAPGTVGVNLNEGHDPSSPLLTLDLHNCDVDVETDTIRPAPACRTTISLPDTWRGRNVQVSYVTPEMHADAPPTSLADDAAVVDHQAGTLRLRTAPFETFLLVFIRTCD